MEELRIRHSGSEGGGLRQLQINIGCVLGSMGSTGRWGPGNLRVVGAPTAKAGMQPTGGAPNAFIQLRCTHKGLRIETGGKAKCMEGTVGAQCKGRKPQALGPGAWPPS